MEGHHPHLAAEALTGWAGDPLSVSVSAESPAGSGEKVVVLTAESVSAGLSGQYEFDENGITSITDAAGQEIRLHRTVREGAKDTVDYWFVLAAGQKTEFTLELEDEIVVDDIIAASGIIENVRTAKAAEKEEDAEAAAAASPSNAIAVEKEDFEQATASNAAKASVSNALKASASDADLVVAVENDEVDVDEDSGEILDGAVIDDIGAADMFEDEETEVTAALKVAAGSGDDLEEAIRDAEKNAEKRGDASLAFTWRAVVNTDAELTWADGGVNVTMFYNASAEIPDGAWLSVVEIEKGSEAYKSYYAGAAAAVNDGSGERVGLASARFFDITLYDADGNEIQPASQVVVKINYDDAVELSENADVKAVHFAEDGAQVIDAVAGGSATALDEVAFNADGFSVYGIFGTEVITFEHISHSGKKYEVKVTFGSDANIPEGSTLRVTDIEEGTKEYEDAKNAVLADKKAKEEAVDLSTFSLAALDISIIDPSGQEIEPEAAVTVDIRIKDLPGEDILEEIKDTLEIQHHVETGNGVVVEKVFDGSVEGSYEMDTDENIAKSGTVVDPGSVSEEDFRKPEPEKEPEPEEAFDLSFETEVFSTFTITWRGGYLNPTRTITVHYVDGSGNELDISNPASTYQNMTASSSSPAFLIYDIDGYEYDYTYRNTNANRIAPLLAKNNNNYWRYTTNLTGNSVNWTEMTNGDNIYVVYKKKADPTTGGTPVIEELDPEDWPQDPATPQFYKSSTNNGNGSNTVSLSISGGEKEYTQSTKANVIVVFDRSGSMGGDNIWRLNTAKSAVNDMANTLLNGDITGVKMALVSFSTAASTVQEFTDSYNAYTRAVNNLTADGGTNWEQALSVANRMAVDSDAATFIVFVTDGDPTFRMSRGDVANNNLDMFNGNTTYQYYRSDNVFGQGNADGQGRNFDFAAEEVKSILANNKTFYAIGVSSDVTKVQNLLNEAGGGTAYLATDAEALEEAFKNITQSIRTDLGFGDIAITDGITELTNVEMKVMQEVDPKSFKYYKVTSSGQAEWDPASEGAGLASYDKTTGAVKWDMGEGFQLEDGVTYTVTFNAWPSQDAYDLVAQLNNGEKVYAPGQTNSITDEERSQIVELRAPTATTQGSYTLKTNTDSVHATYSQTSSTGTTVTVSGETDLEATYHEGTMENMGLTSQLLTIKKIFEQSLDPRQVESVTLKLQRMVNDGEHTMADFNVPGTSSPEIELGNHNDWEYSFYVAPGFILDGETLEPGYKFTVTEPDLGEHTVRYDLIPEIVNPMVIDGTLQLVGDGDGNQALTAINRTRSAVEIHKTLYDVDGTEIYPETEFTVTGRLLGPDGEPFTSQETAAPVAYYLYDRDGNPTTGRMHFPTTADISFTLKPGEFIRFVNVLEGCTFEFQEASMPDNYELDSLAAVGRQRAEDDPEYTYSIELDDEEAHLVEGDTTIATTDEGIIGNTNYKLDFYNKRVIPLPDIDLVKVDQDDDTKKLNEAAFILHKDSPTGEMVTVDGNGKEIHIVTGNKEGSSGPDGWYHIGVLPAGTYYMVETTEPAGYVHDETPVIITVTQNGTSYDVAATRNGENVLSGPTDDLYTITVENEINITEAEAYKAWKNADGTTTAPADASVVFTLFADGEATEYTVTLDGAADETVPETAGGYESEGWTAKFINLTKYKVVDGELTEIVYTIAETTTYPGYTASTADPVESGETITNTQESTEADALKVWENADGTTTAPDGASVVFTLYADGTATDYTVELDGTAETAPTGTAGYESEAWKASFVNLPKYKVVDGEAVEIEYTIAETTTYPGYTPSTTEPVASGETITNSQGVTENYALKAWKNADGSDTAPEGASVVFTLYSDGEETDYTVTLDGTADAEPAGTAGYESEAWTATFVNLPESKIVDGKAEAIVYTIAETTTYPGYTASTTDPVASGSTITNSQDPTEANALKAWVNADGTTEAPQGGQVTYTLYADGNATDYTVTLDGTEDSAPEVTGGYEEEAWKASFVNLPKFKVVDGEAVEIEYTIAESETYPGYTASTTDPVESGKTITNTQEPTDANALKAWKNADGSTTPPEGATVEFKLYADGEMTDHAVTLDGTADEEVPTGTAGYESEAWKALFVNLPKYKVVNGEAVEIVYTIGESQQYAGYTASPEAPVASGEIITNSQDETSADATKKWENADGSNDAPEGAKVVFTLYADGEATDHTVELDGTVDTAPTVTGGHESESWKASFVHLPMYQADGTTEIVYTIAETTGYEGYKASTTEPVASGGSITNSQLSAEIKMLKIGDGDPDNALDGAEFELYSVWNGRDAADNVKAKDASGTEIGTITTAGDGKATIGQLLPGTYYLVETKAPDGYDIISDAVEIRIELAEGDPGYTVYYNQPGYNDSAANGNVEPDEDGIYEITVSDPSGKVLPHTGGRGTLPFRIAGLVLMLMGAAYVSYDFETRRRRERRLKK